MRELFLYHGTSIYNKNAIDHDGLKAGCSPNWEDMYTEGAIYLAFSPAIAEDYVTASPKYAGEEVVIYQIAISSLNEDKIYYDWNNRCETHTDINSVAYKGHIPPQNIREINALQADDEYQDIDSFKGTILYERVMGTFEEEVETNIENNVLEKPEIPPGRTKYFRKKSR